MKCRNGKCIAKELFRDGRDDCGDSTDEPIDTTCSDYLARVIKVRKKGFGLMLSYIQLM